MPSRPQPSSSSLYDSSLQKQVVSQSFLYSVQSLVSTRYLSRQTVRSTFSKSRTRGPMGKGEARAFLRRNVLPTFYRYGCSIVPVLPVLPEMGRKSIVVSYRCVRPEGRTGIRCVRPVRPVLPAGGS